MDDLKSKLSNGISAVYIEIFPYFSFIDDQIYDINDVMRNKDALFIVGADLIPLGVKSPREGLSNVRAPLFKSNLHFKELLAVNIDDAGNSIVWCINNYYERRFMEKSNNEYSELEFCNILLFYFTEFHLKNDIDFTNILRKF